LLSHVPNSGQRSQNLSSFWQMLLDHVPHCWFATDKFRPDWSKHSAREARQLALAKMQATLVLKVKRLQHHLPTLGKAQVEVEVGAEVEVVVVGVMVEVEVVEVVDDGGELVGLVLVVFEEPVVEGLVVVVVILELELEVLVVVVVILELELEVLVVVVVVSELELKVLVVVVVSELELEVLLLLLLVDVELVVESIKSIRIGIDLHCEIYIDSPSYTIELRIYNFLPYMTLTSTRHNRNVYLLAPGVLYQLASGSFKHFPVVTPVHPYLAPSFFLFFKYTKARTTTYQCSHTEPSDRTCKW